MGAGRDTRTKRRTQIGCRSRGKGDESVLVSASLKRVRRRFPSGEEETQGDKQPLLHIPRGAARLWGRHRGEDATLAGLCGSEHSRRARCYICSHHNRGSLVFFSSCWILLSKSRTRPFHVSAPKLRNPLPLARLGNRRAGSGFAGCSRAPWAPHPVRRGWRGWKPTGTPWISSCFVGVMAPLPGDGRAVLPPSRHRSTIPLPSSRPWDLLILSSREGRGQSESLCQELLGEDGKTGQKWGFWKVFLSFPIPRRNKPGFASLFSVFSPCGVQTCPREGEEKLAVIR